jgi:hypothetical protein
MNDTAPGQKRLFDLDAESLRVRTNPGRGRLDELDHPDNWERHPLQDLKPCPACEGSGRMPTPFGDDLVECVFC